MPLVIPPIGVSPLGQFVPATTDTVPTAPPGVLADLVDLRTLEVLSLFQGLHPIDEQVLTALTTVRKSGACVAEVGARFVDVRKLDQGATRRLESEARIALKRLIDRRDIKLIGVDVASDDDWAEVTVRWTNLRASDSARERSTPLRDPSNIASRLAQ
ncbi:MAG TPA: hypothetical protein VH062_02175 [Polyangiaceae bacterium]|nr:hypothetical protein [Polyangiaceae bacterium]